MRILVADGSGLLRERLVSLLSELAGVEMVGQAQDASETLEAICELKPDVVILDTKMRGGSGIEVLKQTRQHHPSTILMILTNQSYQQYRKKYLEAGADFFFSKSSELKLLVGTVRDLALQLLKGKCSIPDARRESAESLPSLCQD
jgi:DNA-binding NarL/FixJ family response regulator